MKTLYNSRIIGSFVNFSCMIFGQNVPRPLEQNLSNVLDQNVLILLLSNIYIMRISNHFGQKYYA